jgi:hypothetical protein
MTSPWQEFVKQAQEIYPAFSNEKLIREALKSKGAVTFKAEYSNQFINDLKSMVNGWQTFLLDAREIDKEFGDDKTVAKILHSYGIPWYGEFDFNNGLDVLKDWQSEKIRRNTPWNYPCPICGAATRRDKKFDYMYRKECNGVGWKCCVGGYTHFHQAAWAPLKKQFVHFNPEVEQREKGTLKVYG